MLTVGSGCEAGLRCLSAEARGRMVPGERTPSRHPESPMRTRLASPRRYGEPRCSRPDPVRRRRGGATRALNRGKRPLTAPQCSILMHPDPWRKCRFVAGLAVRAGGIARCAQRRPTGWMASKEATPFMARMMAVEPDRTCHRIGTPFGRRNPVYAGGGRRRPRADWDSGPDSVSEPAQTGVTSLTAISGDDVRSAARLRRAVPA